MAAMARAGAMAVLMAFFSTPRCGREYSRPSDRGPPGLHVSWKSSRRRPMGRGRRTAITLGMGAAATISLAAFFHQEIRLAWILRKLDPDPGRLDAFLRAEGAAVSWERLERRFRSQPRLPEQPTQFNPPVEERMEEYMAQDVNAALMDLLGLLSEATSRVTQLLRGGAPLSVASTRVMMPVVET